MRPSVVAIGASLGGLHALQTLLAGLPADFPVPLAIVHHRGKEPEPLLAELLQQICSLQVAEPEDKAVLAPGRVWIAPAGYHLLVEASSVALSTEGPILWARPSIDALYESAARSHRRGAVAVVLTGASADGAAGAARVKALGGRVIVQDPAEAESPVLPCAALAATRADRVLALAQIAPYLCELCSPRGEAAA